MKKTISVLLLCLCSTITFAQSGTIINFVVSPASPTTADYVKVYANLEFSSGGCAVSNQNHSTVGNITDASSLHCLGMLAFICSATDTFNLGYLAAGPNAFRFALNVGNAPEPCTPGIVPSDTGSVYFNVANATGINYWDIENAITIFPNPVADELKIESAKYKLVSIKVFDLLGKELIACSPGNNQSAVNVYQLPAGIYFVRIEDDKKNVVNRKVIKE
jgi:hypothetical protein